MRMPPSNVEPLVLTAPVRLMSAWLSRGGLPMKPVKRWVRTMPGAKPLPGGREARVKW
jgi:hypothetical protein